jgi:hypothetical protein
LAIQQYQLAYQISPLYLTAGVAQSAPGSIMPFLSYIQPGGFSVLGPDFLPTAFQTYDSTSLDNAFGSFSVIPGGNLNKNTVAKYPFANSYVAANAIIREPLNISLIWDTPMRGAGAWNIKLATMTSIKKIFDNHINAGGLFTVATPAYIYTNLILTGLTDNSRGTVALPQNAWRFDFERPLVVRAELEQAFYNLSQLFTRVQNGTLTDGSWSGIPPSIGASATQPQSSPGPISVVPSTSTSGQVSGKPNNVPVIA